jgi:hypothetical protein
MRLQSELDMFNVTSERVQSELNMGKGDAAIRAGPGELHEQEGAVGTGHTECQH